MKKVICFLGAAILISLPIRSFSDVLGDINSDGKIDLQEAIYALQIVSGMKPTTDDGFTYNELAGNSFKIFEADFPACTTEITFNDNHTLIIAAHPITSNYTILNGSIVWPDENGVIRTLSVLERNGSEIKTSFTIVGNSFEDRTDRWSIDFPNLNNNATALKDWFIANGWWPGSALLPDGRVTRETVNFDGEWWIYNNVLYIAHPGGDGCVDHKAYELVNDRLLFYTDADRTGTIIMIKK